MPEIETSLNRLANERLGKLAEYENVAKALDEISIPEFDLIEELSEVFENESKSVSEKKSFRLKISSSIREVVSKIIIWQEKIDPWDVDEYTPVEGNFVNIHIYYRNGASQVFYGASGSNLYMESSEKLELLKQRISLSRRG